MRCTVFWVVSLLTLTGESPCGMGQASEKIQKLRRNPQGDSREAWGPYAVRVLQGTGHPLWCQFQPAESWKGEVQCEHCFSLALDGVGRQAQRANCAS